jgi:hypothetical protein
VNRLAAVPAILGMAAFLLTACTAGSPRPAATVTVTETITAPPSQPPSVSSGSCSFSSNRAYVSVMGTDCTTEPNWLNSLASGPWYPADGIPSGSPVACVMTSDGSQGGGTSITVYVSDGQSLAQTVCGALESNGWTVQSGEQSP